MVCTSNYWEQAAALLREHERNDEEAGLELDDWFDCFAEGNCATLGEPAPISVAMESSPRQIPENGTVPFSLTRKLGQSPFGEPVRPEPAERLYVTTCQHNDGIILATLGKMTAEYRRGSTRYLTLSGEFYRIDDESCPAFVLNADFATASQPSAGEASQNRREQQQASGRLSTGAWLEYWAKWWLGDWDVVFRNISRQIARLDWTVLLTGRPSGLAVRNPAPASSSVAR